MKIKLLILIVLFNVTSVFSQEVDLLKNYNGDFENGIAFWRFFEVPYNIGSSWEITDDVVSGNQAMLLDFVKTNGTVKDRGFDNWSAHVPVLGEEEYTGKAFMKSDGTPGLHITFTIGFFNVEGEVISQVSNKYTLTTTYTEHGFTVTTPADAASCWIAFRLFDAANQRVAGTVYLDNVRLLGDSLAYAGLSPRVMPTTIPADDVPIASINVTDEPFNAKNDGSEDATSAFQNAINRASIAGGAVVFVPAGKYRFDGNLNLPSNVVIRGEWLNPDSVGSVTGTILMPFANKNNEAGDPFITMIKSGAGIKNLSIWYPEQSVASVSPYPWTIYCRDVSTSVINVTLVNSYKGIKIGPEPNALHYIRNVYGTPLKQGIWLSQVTDIGRIMNVHFEPKYWSNSGLNSAPSEDGILSWLGDNSTTGITMGRSDWEYIYDVSLVGYKTGMTAFKYSDSGSNGVIYGMRIEKSKTGIDIVNINPIGWAITNSTIKVEGTNSICVHTGNDFNSVVQFNTCIFGGDPKTAVSFSGNATGRLSFQNCTFENWGQNRDVPAIYCYKGAVSLLGNTFNLDKLHVYLGENIKNAQILDNTFPAELKINNQSENEVLISQEPLNFKKLDVPPHPYAAVPRPVTDDLYDVVKFGAIADGVTDNTPVFQAALDSAGNNGGGTVYIPAGMYRLNGHLVIPSGVELRGTWDVQHHTRSKGSILLPVEGKNNADGTPFISLETGAGVRGFTVWYPEQSSDYFFPYPWTIQTLGENCWIKDITLGNSYQGVDLASYPSAGHIVSYLGAAVLKTGISVDKSSGDGWIENVQLNPHYWAHTSGFPQPVTPDIKTIISFQQENLDAFKVASATNEHMMGNFVYAAKRGLYLAPDEGNSNINVFLHGTDAGNNSVFLESKAGSKINLINTQLVLLGTEQNGIITSVPGFDADVAFYNTISWGGPGPSTNLNGNGNVLIQQMHTHNGKYIINNGTTRLENISISSTLSPQYTVGSSISGFKLFGSYAGYGLKLNNQGNNRSIVEADYAYNQSKEDGRLKTGWEFDDVQNTWDNTFFGNKDFIIEDSLSFQCKATATVAAHTGQRALKVVGSKIKADTALYKIFDSRVAVFYSSILSYWLNPQNESGKTGHIDVLFTDGTRLSELGAVALDGLPLNAARGKIGEWTKVKCGIGDYAQGKIIQSILVGAELSSDTKYGFLIDDLNIEIFASVQPELSDNGELSSVQSYPNPFHRQTTISYLLNKDGHITLSVYNLLGKKLCVLKNKQYQNAGKHEIEWAPNNLEKGIYFYRLEFLSGTGEKRVINRKMIIQ